MPSLLTSAIMELTKAIEKYTNTNQADVTTSKKRRIRRRKALASRASIKKGTPIGKENNAIEVSNTSNTINTLKYESLVVTVPHSVNCDLVSDSKASIMSSKQNTSREEVLAAREAKKIAKQKSKTKDATNNDNVIENKTCNLLNDSPAKEKELEKPIKNNPIVKDKDEVDKCTPMTTEISGGVEKNKDEVKAARVAKKLAKKKGVKEVADDNLTITKESLSNKTVVDSLDKIVGIVKEMREVSDKLEAFKIDDGGKKEEPGKSKAVLKAERRAKQEAQRAAKASTQNVAHSKAKVENAKKEEKPSAVTVTTKEEKKMPKSKSTDKTVSKLKSQSGHRVDWFQHLYTEHEASLKNIGINNANLHPVIVKLGVQLASRVVSGSNARCIALLNALKQMVKDYTLPAKTEFGRGLESSLVTSLNFLWSMRKPSTSQTNAVKFFRYQLTQLPNNVNEFVAKSSLQEAIDTYIREQIDMAGEAISLSVRKKISNGDNILTYGCSSLVERALAEAWAAGVRYRAVVAGARCGGGARARELLRRLRARGVPCSYVDVTAVGFVMPATTKVIVGACSLLVNGWVMGTAGTSLVALAARAHNVPVLVCCERHKFSERVQTDAFVYNEIGDPDDLIDKSDENSPLKDWRSNPNLTLLNLMYDVTPPSLVTAVITDLAILPCSSAPVVLRFMLSEYGF